MSITQDARRKLIGLLGKLGTDNDNERASVGKLIDAGRKALGLQWEDLIVPPLTVAAYREGPLNFNAAPRQTAGAPPTGETVEDLFDDPDTFEVLLDDAEHGAQKDNEINFVADMRAKFERYGVVMFLSERQLAWLNSIAGH